MSNNNPEILYQDLGDVALITMQSRNGLNSLTISFVELLHALISKANADKNIGAIVITGTGAAFSAGADMQDLFLPKMRGDVPMDENDHFLGGLGLLPEDWTAFIRASKPIVVAFNGYAVGGGMTFFLAADVLVASTKASFHFIFTQVGIVAEMCSSKYLPARVGFGRASELLLQARVIKGDEAKQIALIDFLVEPEELVDEAIKIAKRIAAQPPTMVQMTKQLLDQNYLEPDTSKVWQRESDALRACWPNAEHKEAVAAFFDKRKPNFKNLT